MTKSLQELQRLCQMHGLPVSAQRRIAREVYVRALRDHFWHREHPHQTLPEQTEPMLLGDWNDLDAAEAEAVGRDDSRWCVQEKHDGVRALLYITAGGVRITGRNISDVTFRLSEFQSNLPHLAVGFESLVGSIFDGELVCPIAEVDTGNTMTQHALQGAVAILSTTADEARSIQSQQNCPLRFVAFDVLRFCGDDVTTLPLAPRLNVLETAAGLASNPHLQKIETCTAEKAAFHETLIASGREGSVWKRLDQPYEAGRRVRHWLKRKRAVEVEAFVSGFKLGSPGRGNEHLVGAVEFSAQQADGATRPVGWICNWSDENRRRLTHRDGRSVSLNPAFLGRRAVIAGNDFAARSGRIRHARLVKWV